MKGRVLPVSLAFVTGPVAEGPRPTSVRPAMRPHHPWRPEARPRRPRRRWRARTATALLAASLALATPPPLGAAPSSPSLAGAEAAGEQAGPIPRSDGAALRVWLVTAAPGPAVWERFGHNAIRVLDTRTGRDVSYNWGIFDFQQVDFIPRFLRGQMLYMMAAFPTAPMLDSYLRVGRPVALQELALTAEEKGRLAGFLEWNALPENREYFYDYFLDNCSTRARDALDRVLGGVLAERFEDEPTGTSYRYHTRRLTRMDPWVYTGMDLLLGSPGDRPITVWEEMFLPMTLREAVREVTLAGPDEADRPLVLREEVLEPTATVPEAPRGASEEPAGLAPAREASTSPWGPPSPPGWLLRYLLVGLALAALVAWSGMRAGDASPAIPPARVADDGSASGRLWRVLGGAVASAWSAGVGVVGTVLVLVLFTDHQFMAWNENLFLFTPLSLALAIVAPMALAGTSGVRAARLLGWAVAGIAVLGLLVHLLPGSRQENAIFFALVLPAHLALAWTLDRRARGAGTPPPPPRA